MILSKWHPNFAAFFDLLHFDSSAFAPMLISPAWLVAGGRLGIWTWKPWVHPVVHSRNGSNGSTSHWSNLFSNQKWLASRGFHKYHSNPFRILIFRTSIVTHAPFFFQGIQSQVGISSTGWSIGDVSTFVSQVQVFSISPGTQRRIFSYSGEAWGNPLGTWLWFSQSKCTQRTQIWSTLHRAHMCGTKKKIGTLKSGSSTKTTGNTFLCTWSWRLW